jgi:hypothetical protein
VKDAKGEGPVGDTIRLTAAQATMRRSSVQMAEDGRRRIVN